MVFIANVPIEGLESETPNCVIPWISIEFIYLSKFEEPKVLTIFRLKFLYYLNCEFSKQPNYFLDLIYIVYVFTLKPLSPWYDNSPYHIYYHFTLYIHIYIHTY